MRAKEKVDLQEVMEITEEKEVVEVTVTLNSKGIDRLQNAIKVYNCIADDAISGELQVDRVKIEFVRNEVTFIIDQT